MRYHLQNNKPWAPAVNHIMTTTALRRLQDTPAGFVYVIYDSLRSCVGQIYENHIPSQRDPPVRRYDTVWAI